MKDVFEKTVGVVCPCGEGCKCGPDCACREGYRD